MAVDDVALALIHLDKPGTRDRMASGDTSTLDRFSLTDQEREPCTAPPRTTPKWRVFNWVSPRYMPALQYLTANRDALSPGVRNQFTDSFTATHGSSWKLMIMG